MVPYMIVTSEQRQIIFNALSKSLRRRPVRWTVGAFSLVNTLLLTVLVLTEQLRWVPAPWPLLVTRTLFQAFFITSVADLLLFGLTGVWMAVYLYRRGGTNPRADPMTLLRRTFITPATYLLSTMWGWAWLTGHSPRIFGKAVIAFFVIHQVVLTIYYTVSAFRKARAADVARGTGAPTSVGGRRLARVLRGRLLARGRRIQRALSRRWWLLSHQNYIERLSVSDKALFQSVVRGVTHNVEVLLKRGGNPNLKLVYGMPLIALCASMGRIEAVRALLDAGADIDAASPSLGFNALLNAADKGNLTLMHLLIKRGADVEARISSGATPLMLAARNGHSKAVIFLLANGSQADVANKTGVTALIFAAIFGDEEAVQALLNAGANPSARTVGGSTALDYAIREGHQHVAELLTAHRAATERGEEKKQPR